MDVYLVQNLAARETYGIFSNMDKGKDQCQQVANEYFGEKHTDPLVWRGDKDYQTASHYGPMETYTFTVTRFTVDEVCD